MTTHWIRRTLRTALLGAALAAAPALASDAVPAGARTTGTAAAKTGGEMHRAHAAKKADDRMDRERDAARAPSSEWVRMVHTAP